MLPLSPGGFSARETVPGAFVRIEAGKFQRGGLEHDEDEITVHNVYISQHFLISDHEVTLGEFQEFVEATGYRSESDPGEGCYFHTGENWKKDPTKTWLDPGFSQGVDHPVACVSWHDAQAYIA